MISQERGSPSVRAVTSRMSAVVHQIHDAARKHNATTDAAEVHHLPKEAIVAEVGARLADLRARIAKLEAEIAEVTYDRDCWRDAALTWRRVRNFEFAEAKCFAERTVTRNAG